MGGNGFRGDPGRTRGLICHFNEDLPVLTNYYHRENAYKVFYELSACSSWRTEIGSRPSGSW
jgi:hypothetical protein